jgi:hypothetical protein
MITLLHTNLDDLLCNADEQLAPIPSLAERQRVADANMAPRRDEQ